jgi:hypothetical protein
MPKLAHLLKQPVVVANPVYFGDDAPRRLILVDIEAAGLWFSGADLHESLAEHALTAPPADAVATVFFPFEHIAYLVDPHQFARLPRGQNATGGSGMDAAQSPPKNGESKRPSGDRPSRKNPRPKR